MLNENTDYNGWSNRETWAYALWLDNDEGFYWQITEAIEDICKREGKDFELDALMKLSDFTANLLEELVQTRDDGHANDQLKNMLNDIGSIWRVNHFEIAEKSYGDAIREQLAENERE